MRREKIWMWLAWRMPKRLVYFCGVRMGAHATTGPYSKEEAPSLYFMEALRRWSRDHWGWT